MAEAMTTGSTIVGALWPSRSENRLWRAALLAVLGSALLAVSAQIEVPFWPVPMTMQTLAVMIIGMTYGWRLAGATTALYLFEGAVGLPVFAGGAFGLVALFGPTCGYLFGFVVGAVIMGLLSERGWDRHIATAVAALFLGTAVVFLLGYLWLAYFLGNMETAFNAGVVPFVLGDLCKIALAAALLPLAWKVIDRKSDKV